MAFHRRGDRQMTEVLKAEDLGAMRFRDRVMHAVRCASNWWSRTRRRCAGGRRSSPCRSMPPTGRARSGKRPMRSGRRWAMPSDDLNWYSKRAILSGVYSSTVLYWLGDQSPGHAATWAFLDRRIEEVMRFETLKRQAREPGAWPAAGGTDWVGQAGARAIGHTARRPAGALARLNRGGRFPRGKRYRKTRVFRRGFAGNSAHALAERAGPGMP
jgi:ubiquinone biosynthesis protein COQ9